MSRHDETDGWIFTDGFHSWLDTHRRLGYRHGTEAEAQAGWFIGLFTIKEDWTDRLDPLAMASWPKPTKHHDLISEEETHELHRSRR